MTYVGPGSGRDYVAGAHQLCVNGRCQWRQATEILAQARQYVEQHTGRSSMSQAMWCDQGGHAFSERDPGRQRITVAVLDDDGAEQEETRDLCGDCAEQAGLLKKRQTRPAAAIPAPDRPHADPGRIRDLETELGMPHSV
jgi:hypothetical protein